MIEGGSQTRDEVPGHQRKLKGRIIDFHGQNKISALLRVRQSMGLRFRKVLMGGIEFGKVLLCPLNLEFGIT